MKTCARLSGTVEEMLAQARLAKQAGADIVRLELGSAENLELLDVFPLPALLSAGNRKDVAAAAGLLLQAMKFRSEFVEVDASYPREWRKKLTDMARMNGIKLMLSYAGRGACSIGKLKRVLDETAKISSYLNMETGCLDRDVFKELFEAAKKKNVRLTIPEAGANPGNFLFYCRLGNGAGGTATPTLKQARLLINKRIEKRIREKMRKPHASL